MQILTVLALLALVGLVVYRYRRSLIARLMGLSPPRHAVTVTRDIPMLTPEGVRLTTDHYAPKEKGGKVPLPTILIRTPYGRGDLSVIAHLFTERGYHVIVQDVRGRFDSGGEFSPVINERSDGQATLDWIAQQPWFSGEVGTWGPSYLGYVQWAVAADAPPLLKAMVPSMTSPESFSVTHPDGPSAWTRGYTGYVRSKPRLECRSNPGGKGFGKRWRCCQVDKPANWKQPLTTCH